MRTVSNILEIKEKIVMYALSNPKLASGGKNYANHDRDFKDKRENSIVCSVNICYVHLCVTEVWLGHHMSLRCHSQGGSHEEMLQW